MQVYLPIAEVSVSVLLLLGLGGVVGILSGIFGVGGGFLITPLLFFLGIPPSVAVATGANQVVASSVSGVLAQIRRKGVDFRCIRFPGLISAFTVPSGGTSDYGPEMIHAAAQSKPYECFVREDTRISFMAMPDAIDALQQLMHAPAEKLSRVVYNITAMSPSAGEFAERTLKAFPAGKVSFKPDLRRQGIVDSWPLDVDDSAARQDFGFKPAFDFARTFDEYLVPNIKKRYAT